MVTNELANQQRELARSQIQLNSIVEIGTITAVSTNGAFCYS